MNYNYVNKKNCAIYINFPFCKQPCLYCHYVNNIKFFHSEIPKNYFNIICEQLKHILTKINNTELESIYFGGGTASLLNDNQIKEIQNILSLNNIKSKEISIEIYPGQCNFNILENSFFTRYSIGVQSFLPSIRKKYRRTEYKNKDIEELIKKIQAKQKIINIDILFDEYIDEEEIVNIINLFPDTVTFYPNTKGRGIKRLKNVLNTLEMVEQKLIGYKKMMNNKMIFIRNNAEVSRYSKLEYETCGDIVGVGHNSISNIGNQSYLCLYDHGEIKIKKRDFIGDRKLHIIMSGISSGISKDLLNHYMCDIFKFNIIESCNITNLVFVPEYNFIRFLRFISKKFDKTYVDAFLSSVGYGDNCLETIKSVYKIKAPDIFLLVEGIDGSGKDTFAKILFNKLTKRFAYMTEKGISITGEPNSSLAYGKEAKNFIENLEHNNPEEVANWLISNRIDSEKKLIKLGGIVILVRGLLTDKATFFRAFDEERFLGESSFIKKWHKLIVIDIEPEIAYQRILKRGTKQTWRENIENLNYFRNFYINYNSEIFKEKIIIKNDSLDALEKKAEELAEEIYELE